MTRRQRVVRGVVTAVIVAAVVAVIVFEGVTYDLNKREKT